MLISNVLFLISGPNAGLRSTRHNPIQVTCAALEVLQICLMGEHGESFSDLLSFTYIFLPFVPHNFRFSSFTRAARYLFFLNRGLMSYSLTLCCLTLIGALIFYIPLTVIAFDISHQSVSSICKLLYTLISTFHIDERFYFCHYFIQITINVPIHDMNSITY